MLTNPEIIEKIAARIRKVDGDHTMGAAELAESLLPTIRHLVSVATADTAEVAYDHVTARGGLPSGLPMALLDVNSRTLSEYGPLTPG